MRRIILDALGFADGYDGRVPPVLPDDEHEVYWQARRRGVEVSGRLARPETFSAYSLAVLAAPIGQRPRSDS